MLTGGQIEPSDSPWSAPVVLVTKKDGGTRFYVDYRRLNLAKDAYPLPRIDDTWDMLAGKRWFSTLDLASGYWQVSLSPDARCKTAFATHSGLFQFKVMPFGRTGHLREVNGSSSARITMVPLPCVFGRHHLFRDDVRQRTGQPDIDFRASALLWTAIEVNKVSSVPDVCAFLEHVVGMKGLQRDPRKIEDVKSWPVPDCLKSVRQFLGFVGNYRRCISNFADMAEPLVSLTGKDVPFVWRPACSTALTGLRDALVRAPILSFPTEDGDYILDTDASNFGLGGVLSQIQDNVERVIAYCSRAYDRRSGNTVLPRGKCWLLSLCVCSFVHIYVELNLHSERITSP